MAKGEIAAPLRRRGPRGTEALRPAGDQHELARRRRRRDEAATLIVDEQAAIDGFADLDAASGVGAAVEAPGNLHPPGAETDGVVPRHDAGVAAAEPIDEIARRPAPHPVGLGRGLGKAAVVVGEMGGQECFGRGHRGDRVKAQFSDQAILKGGPEPFDAALGLGGVRGDVADAEVAQDLAEVGRMLRPLEFLLSRSPYSVTGRPWCWASRCSRVR